MKFLRTLSLILIIIAPSVQAMRRAVSSGKLVQRTAAHRPAAHAHQSSFQDDMARAIQESEDDERIRHAAVAREHAARISSQEAEDAALAQAIRASLALAQHPEEQQAPQAAMQDTPAIRPHGFFKPTTPHDELPLPRVLRELPGVTIHHIVVTQQRANQCGSRSVANALAVQDLISANRPLTARAIRDAAERYDRILINHVIDDYTIGRMVRDNHLFNAHILARNPRKAYDAGRNPFIVQSIDTHASSLDDIVFQLRTEATITTQFICNTGGHWILITIIKQEGYRPQILLMDSCNSQLENGFIATTYIRFLYDACIR